MKKHRLNNYLKAVVVGFMVCVVISFAITSFASTEKENFEVTPGVDYTHYEEPSKNNSVRVMEVDLNRPHLTVGLGMDTQPFTLLSTSNIARKFSQANYRMVGGINGSFFHFDTIKPSYLVSQNGNILNLGAVSSDSSGYMHLPTAFGMKKDGRAIIDYFSINMSAEINGVVHEIDKFNSSRGAGEAVLYTPSYRWDWTRNNEYGVEIFVHKASKQVDSANMKFGDTIEGEVMAIKPYLSKKYYQIPTDGFVISVHGNSNIAEGLKVGDPIKLTVDIDQKWKNTDFIMASGPKLVDGGKVDLDINESSSNARQVTSRTAVGINQDGTKVYFITVDRWNSSRGMTLPEFANYIQSLGVYKAINLDGGGSTTMVARQYGDEYATVVNNPSNGFERGVINGLYAVVTSESNVASKMSIQLKEQGSILAGGKVDVKLNYILDEFYHPMSVNLSDIDLKVEGNIGRMEGSTFVAERAGTGSIVATYQGATASIPVQVVSKVDYVKIEPGDITIGLGQKQQYKATPYMNDGSKVIWNPSSLKWSVSGHAGSIDENGLFTAGASRASGKVIATINDHPYSTNISVGGENVVYETFSNMTNWSSSNIRANGHIRLSESFEPVAFGNRSLRIEYDFTNQESGTSAVYANYTGDVLIADRPKDIGMWVYGDQNKHWLRARLTDGAGKIHYISLTEESGLNWNGWRYSSANIPNDVVLPFTLDQIYVVETSDNKKDRGVIFIDRVILSFDGQDDHRQDLEVFDVVPTNKQWKITFDKPISRTSISESSLYILDGLGKKHPITYEFSDDQTVITVKPKTPFTSGEFYQLVINGNVISEDGYSKMGVTTKTFKVK